MDVGIVGKPNVGKSTFFSAVTMAPAAIANYPFTTVDANVGVGYVRGECPHVELGVQCMPNNSQCDNGTRLIPVELIDVAGLVPDAWQGKGLGNKFLDDLRQASALIHIVDASGGTTIDGMPCKVGEHDSLEDVEFLDREVSYWLRSIILKDWKKIARQSSLEGMKVERLIHERLTGLAISETQILAAIRKTDLDPSPDKWTDDDLLALSHAIRKTGKPMIIAANKCDVAPEEHLKSLMEKKDTIVIPTSAEYELALRKAAKAGLVEYEIGSDSFKITDASKLTNAQAKGLEKVAEFLKAFGCTGVQRCIETAVFDLLDLIPVYPVEDEHKYTDKEGRVLPDVYLMPKGSNARELAYKVHTELGDNFIRAIDARTKRVIGQDHELRKDDVITIVARK